MAGKLAAFHEFRSRTNAKLLSKGNLQLKRFFNLDTQVYTNGALPSRTKELMGFVASAVLRCDDCITYHLIRCAEEGVTDEEFFETFNVILVVGGSITIPHLRRAVETLEEIRATPQGKKVKRDKGEKGKKDETDFNPADTDLARCCHRSRLKTHSGLRRNPNEYPG